MPYRAEGGGVFWCLPRHKSLMLVAVVAMSVLCYW